MKELYSEDFLLEFFSYTLDQIIHTSSNPDTPIDM